MRRSSSTQIHTQMLNKYSRVVTEPKSQGASQAMLYATGAFKTERDLAKPQVGIVSNWYEGNPVRYFYPLAIQCFHIR